MSLLEQACDLLWTSTLVWIVEPHRVVIADSQCQRKLAVVCKSYGGRGFWCHEPDSNLWILLLRCPGGPRRRSCVEVYSKEGWRLCRWYIDDWVQGDQLFVSEGRVYALVNEKVISWDWSGQKKRVEIDVPSGVSQLAVDQDYFFYDESESSVAMHPRSKKRKRRCQIQLPLKWMPEARSRLAVTPLALYYLQDHRLVRIRKDSRALEYVDNLPASVNGYSLVQHTLVLWSESQIWIHHDFETALDWKRADLAEEEDTCSKSKRSALAF